MSTPEFQWQPSSATSDYPPHLLTIPDYLSLRIDQILDLQALGETQAVLTGQASKELLALAPTNCKTMKEVTDFVRANHKVQARNLYKAPNIGLRDDWYTDAVFGQQTLTGAHPSVIRRADDKWIHQFRAEADNQHLDEVVKMLNGDPKSFFVLDYSYIYTAMRVPNPETGLPTRNDGGRPKGYGGASVTLFRFEPEGTMHPFAICLDHHGPNSLSNVFIFNRRLTSSANGDEAKDWPWRYAKTVSQVANWLGHEVGSHLVKAHLIEESCLTAAHIAFASKEDHFVFQLIKPHRDVTFAINKSAREVLVPAIIVPAAGFPKDNVYTFLNYTYRDFRWKASYVPIDLAQRGFPMDQLHTSKYRNCAWARGVAEMWRIVRNFVATVLRSQYPGGDKDVAADKFVAQFCKEMREANKGALADFPSRIQTLDDLIDVVTNIIHIATSQHTSINYLQQYYMTFVPNFPGSVYTPLPTTTEDLAKIDEKALLRALPITTLPVPEGGTDYRPEWLIQGQVPYLLSFAPPMDKSLLHYATETATSTTVRCEMRAAARTLKEDLDRFAITVREISAQMDDKQTDYLVLDPYLTTSSIIL